MTVRDPLTPPDDLPDSELDETADLQDGLLDEALLALDDTDADGAVSPGSLATGRAAIAAAVKHAPSGAGVYRMLDAEDTVLYVGKAKSIKRRIIAYTRPTGLTNRIARMVSATARMEFVSTGTEREALLLEANLIKQLRPRFNVLLRDDKSFPYILITRDHDAPQITKHRGARSRPGDYYGPFASVWAVNRTINALQKAFLVRSCTDSFYEGRTRPCLLFQIKRCAGPCTGEVDHATYAEYVREARDFLSGKSRSVKEQLAKEMQAASDALEFERAAALRDRLAALSAVQGTQGINPRSVEEADVFAIHQEGGATCVQVFFFRTGQNWGNHPYYPRADRSLEPGEVLGAFLAQFYEDKPCPRLILLSHPVEDAELLADALSERAGHRVEIAVPQRGEKRELVEHAAQNAREALGRKLAETASQARLLDELARAFALPGTPRRIEVYDNSHIMGTNAVGGMIVAGPEGFAKSQYRKFNIRSTDLTPGDDYGMMREVLNRRFARLLKEAPRAGTGTATVATGEAAASGAVASTDPVAPIAEAPHPTHLPHGERGAAPGSVAARRHGEAEDEARVAGTAGAEADGLAEAADAVDGRSEHAPDSMASSAHGARSRYGAAPPPRGGEGGDERHNTPVSERDKAPASEDAADAPAQASLPAQASSPASRDPDDLTGWPDLVLIDGGQGQLKAAAETLAALGITDVPLVGVAKGPDRDAGRETFFMAGRTPFRLEPRDPVLYFVQRLRDEAHRFAIGSHRARRKKDITQAGLSEITGVGPTRKRALLHHFGTLKAIERASLTDLAAVPGVNEATARAVYDYFHAKGG
ncbi:excinuclease ABC subunit UvrC [Ancylobacter sp. 6x-1]|uniref:UvrABC system protein C n=1 Tax=Ancylobacter crimeensis TaxID=2579147 RepID=A0ABT0D9Q6_9HYPH|nr:excinuclease ABC subunit UvrC [Ancylobacter crimeensis]MCK0196693.1 excinuclease ABC subunit UvrC [Ancylobacter crimeensis]